jgi:hypothetical protein
MTRSLSLPLFCLIALAGAACGAPPIQPVAYAPQPQRVADPETELAALITSNTTAGCVSEPTFQGPSLVVKFVCSRAIGNVVLRFDRVTRVELQQQGPWYRVRAHHRDGVEDFFWDSKSLEDAQRIDDCIEAILRRRGPARPTPGTTTL